MAKDSLQAQVRVVTGKEKVKVLRAEGLLPAVFYGRHVKDPITLVLDRKVFETKIYNNIAGVNTIFDLTIDDNGKDIQELAIAHEIQYDAITDEVRHVDFQQINIKEEIHATIPLRFTGVAPGVKMGGQLVTLVDYIDVKCLPLDLPPEIEVDISGLNIGDGIKSTDLGVADSVKLLISEKQVIIHVEGAKREALADEEETPLTAAPAGNSSEGESSD